LENSIETGAYLLGDHSPSRSYHRLIVSHIVLVFTN